MEPVSISIRLDTQSSRPGESIRGRVTFRAVEPWQVRRAEVMLYWLAANEHSDSEGIAATEVLLEKGTEAPPSMERQFNLQLPPMPWSYEGKLFKITWYIGVTAHARGAKKATEEVELLVLP